MPLHPVLVLVLAQRLLELVYAAGNTRRLRARGAVEVGAGHYPLMIVLHGAWWLALAATVPPDRPAHTLPLIGFAVLMVGRVWVLLSLGPYWTTRILTLPGAPLVRSGPYAWLRHPNYWIVAGEVALIPLAFDAIGIAVLFSILNGALLAWRVAVEDKVITARGSSAASG